MRITVEFIHQHRSPRGGWNAAQLRAIGVPWPPQSGWVERAAARDHAPDAIDRFIASATLKPRDLRLAAAQAAHPGAAQPSLFDQPHAMNPIFDLPACNCACPPWDDCEHTEARIDPASAHFIRSIAQEVVTC